MKSTYSVLAWSILCLLALIWGSSFILIKKGLVVLSPGEVGALRITAASLFMIPFALARLKRVEPTKWKYILSVGLSGSLIPAFLFAIAQTQLPSSITGVLNALTPLFTILIGWIGFSSRPGKEVYIGMGIGFIGTSILILASGEGEFSVNYYAFFVILATILYGFNVNTIKHHLQGISSTTITSISLVMVGPLAIGFLFGFTNFVTTVQTSQGAWFATSYIVLLGIMGTAIALIIFNRLVQMTDPVFASSVTYIIPIVAIGWGLIDGEILNLWHYLGIGGIILGVWIANRPPQNLKTRPRT